MRNRRPPRPGKIAIALAISVAVVAAIAAGAGWMQTVRHRDRAAMRAEDADHARAQAAEARAEVQALSDRVTTTAEELGAARERVKWLTAELEEVRAEREQAATDASATAGADAVADDAVALVRYMFVRSIYAVEDDPDEARSSQQSVLNEVAKKLGSYTRRRAPEAVASANHTLGSMYLNAGVTEGGEGPLRDALASRTSTLGADHADTLSTKSTLAQLLARRGHWEEALKLQGELVDRARVDPGEKNANLLGALPRLRAYLVYVERLEEAEDAGREELELRRERGGWRAWNVLRDVGALQREQGKLEEAESTFRELLAIELDEEGEYSLRTLTARCHLAWTFHLQGRDDAGARALHEHIVDTARFMRAINQPVTTTPYGRYMVARGEYEEAEYYLLAQYKRNKPLRRPLMLIEDLRPLIRLYEETGRQEEADRCRLDLVQPVPMG